MKRIGYIGLGLMGAPMARNLLKAGFEVVVHNRSRAIVDQLVSEGAIAATSPREVAAQVEVVCTNLPDSPDVEQVVLGVDGIRDGGHPGLIYVDHSTIKPETARKIAAVLAERGVAALDAPVSGGQIGAQGGTLAIMVGGDKATFEAVEPMFKAVGRRWALVGGPGAGQVAKACNQIMVGAQMAALAELLALAQANGVDPFAVTEAIKDGAAQCWTLDNKPPRLKQGNRTPGFKAYMQLKDLKIVADTARTSNLDLPLNAALVRLFQTLIDNGDGELDNSALISVYEKTNGLHVGPE
jgi:2-hydroxy-3-oxopropionate reductase